MVVLHQCHLLQNQCRDKTLEQCLLSIGRGWAHPLSPRDAAATIDGKNNILLMCHVYIVVPLCFYIATALL